MKKFPTLVIQLGIPLLVILFIGMSVSSVHAAAAIRPATNLGLKAWWTFDEATSTIAHDFSGNQNTGTLQNAPVWVPGKLGTALSFTSASSQYVSAATGFANFTTGVTVSVWANPTSVNSWARFMDFGNGQSNDNILLARNASSNDLTFEVYTGGSTGGKVTATNGIINNSWHLYTATEDNLGNVKLYRDGVQIQTGTTAVPNNVSRTINYIGRSNWVADAYYAGQMDDMRIYNRAISAAEVATLYTTTSSVRKEVSHNGLIGYWNFDEGTSTTAHDSSGIGNKGTLNNAPSWVSGRLGQALSFDGSSTYVQAPIASVPTNFTLSAWIKLNQLGKEQHIADFSSNSQFYVNSANKLGSSNFSNATGATTLSANVWYHVVEVRNGTNVLLYLNGVQDASGTNGTSYSSPLYIGRYWGAGNFYFNGLIDDVRLYNRALSTAEISQLYKETSASVNAPAPARTTGSSLTSSLVGLWTMDGQDTNWNTNTEADKSGNGDIGNLVNFSTTTSPVAGKMGQALSFNGTNQYVSLGTPSGPTGAVTISAWVYKNANTAWTSILDRYGNENLDCLSLGFDSSTGSNLMFMWNNAAPFNNRVTSNSAVPTGRWVFVAASSDGSTVTFYQNGVADGSASVGAPCATGPLEIGVNFPGGDEYLNGKIDDVRLYSRALSAPEIKQLYNLGK